MAINTDGVGQFSIDYWRTTEPVGMPAHIEYGDNLDELEVNCRRYLAAKRFAIGVAHRRADTPEGWQPN